jgi:multiple sugar transport system permease protein
LENFQTAFSSPLVRIALRNTLIFVLLAAPLRLAGAFGLALLLRPGGRLFAFSRAAAYLPTIIPEVAYALIWLWIFNPMYGPLNGLLGALGLPAPDWLANAATARLAIVLMLSFQVGEGFIVALAGLQNIPRAYYEAADMDGANPWQKFGYITLPLVTPLLLLLSFRDLVVALQSTFTPSFVMTYGGPYYATTFAPLMIYELAFDFFDLGLGSAVLVLTYLLLGLIVLQILNLADGLRAEHVLE